MFIKVCGLKKFEDIDCAIDLGYSAIGVVLHPKSARYCNIKKAKELSEYAKGKITTVAVGITYNEIKDIIPNFDFIQVYETIDSNKLIYAGKTVPENLKYKYFLYDVSIGSGEFHELPKWLTEVKEKLIISGGLNAGNVKNVIQKFNPFGVDVSSGVEIEKGIKDHKLMKKFITEVNNATR